ncbi:MAG: helix-turn-helix domain-containing protein [Candidatus Competibacter sp.]|nr:helix-turn-helix domain-containing protein [Candidatus Competibacter sp.]
MHEIRRRLLTSCRKDASVADIAHHQGFYELGRFASDYQRLFGELPSQTLGRPTPEPQRGLLRSVA